MLQITRKNISLADIESKFSIKSEKMQALQSKMEEKIQALQSRAEELERDLFLAQEKLSEMKSLQSRAKNLERCHIWFSTLLAKSNSFPLFT